MLEIKHYEQTRPFYQKKFNGWGETRPQSFRRRDEGAINWKRILKTSPWCDLRNRKSDQNLSVIKVAGNQKLWTNGDFLLIKVQRLRRNSSSIFCPFLVCNTQCACSVCRYLLKMNANIKTIWHFRCICISFMQK